MTAVVLLELGLHNPLAAAVERARESEWASQLLAHLPGRARTVRLRASSRDPRTAPVFKLAQSYARRWEHELYFREVKRQLCKTAVLQSHTVETGAQEIAAVAFGEGVLSERQMQTMLKRG